MRVCIDGGHGNGKTRTCVQVRAATSMALIDDARAARAARAVNGVTDGQRGQAARAAGDERNDEQARAAPHPGAVRWRRTACCVQQSQCLALI